jgi:hypothetical protein
MAHQMTLKALERLAILQADDVVRLNTSPYRYRRLRLPPSRLSCRDAQLRLGIRVQQGPTKTDFGCHLKPLKLQS